MAATLIGRGVTLALAVAAAAVGSPPVIGVNLASGSDVMAISQHDHAGSIATYVVRNDATPAAPVRRAAADLIVRKRRSRGPQAKPRRKSNRLHTSRRVRRKHRRAA